MRPDFKEVIKTGWTTGINRRNKWANVKGKLEQCKKTIPVWVRKNVQAVEGLIKTKTKEFEVLQEGADGHNQEEEKALREEINGLLEQEELKWKQRAKEEWLKSRNRNTKYFHAYATQRRRRNTIDQILDVGSICVIRLNPLRMLL
jgi:wobble nucleotide-excising tRNase